MQPRWSPSWIPCFALASALALTAAAEAQELTFENLDFDVMHNVELTKEDLVGKVVLIHLWGTT